MYSQPRPRPTRADGIGFAMTRSTMLDPVSIAVSPALLAMCVAELAASLAYSPTVLAASLAYSVTVLAAPLAMSATVPAAPLAMWPALSIMPPLDSSPLRYVLDPVAAPAP